MRHPSPCWFMLLAALSSAAFTSSSAGQAQILGPNLIYTSVQGCRLFDTRAASPTGTNGRLLHGMAQSFNVVGGNVNPTTFTAQGGHDGGCGIPGFNADGPQVQAVVLNLVAVGAAGAGHLVAWPTDRAQPISSVLNYASAANLGFLNIANGVVLPVRQDLPGSDITLKAQTSDTDVVGDVTGYFSSGSPTQGSGNLFLGAGAGNPAVTTGSFNTALGDGSLPADTTGGFNTAVGNRALKANTSGDANTAVGSSSLAANTNGFGNTALGQAALAANTAGVSNTALGATALQANTGGGFNTVAGAGALQSNTTGSSNTAVGVDALQDTTSGSNNVVVGLGAGLLNTAGSNNVLIGMNAGTHTTGDNNIALGFGAGSQIAGGTGNIDIGNAAPGDESNVIRIGGSQTATFLAGVSGATSAGGTAVLVNGAGRLGTATSSLRFKEDVEDMAAVSAVLMRLRPVTFHYKPGFDDGSHLLQYGLIAEEVAGVSPGLVQYDQEGRPLAVRYHFVNAMLLNEVQRQRAQIEALAARLARLEAERACPQRP
jgi:hypothetical protein